MLHYIFMIGLAFTPEQFKTLLRMIYIANTVANGHRDEEILKEYDDLEQYIFSRAESAGLPAATWRHEGGGGARPSRPPRGGTRSRGRRTITLPVYLKTIRKSTA